MLLWSLRFDVLALVCSLCCEIAISWKRVFFSNHHQRQKKKKVKVLQWIPIQNRTFWDIWHVFIYGSTWNSGNPRLHSYTDSQDLLIEQEISYLLRGSMYLTLFIIYIQCYLEKEGKYFYSWWFLILYFLPIVSPSW